MILGDIFCLKLAIFLFKLCNLSLHVFNPLIETVDTALVLLVLCKGNVYLFFHVSNAFMEGVSLVLCGLF
jgi:hypothetical protein